MNKEDRFLETQSINQQFQLTENNSIYTRTITINFPETITVLENHRVLQLERTIYIVWWTINWAINNRYDKAFKKRERKIKNTKIYTSLPFLKGYVQSFVNQQRILLTKISKISLLQYKLFATRKKPLLPWWLQTIHVESFDPCRLHHIVGFIKSLSKPWC